jgi:prepilin-type N-terminal cleavage/methylation domain-containing protein
MRCYHPFVRSKGFTLIELAIATALAALLMLGVLMILTGIIRDRRMVSEDGHSSTNPDWVALVDLVRGDLNCASDLQVEENGAIEIHTTASLDTQTLQPTDRPSVVTYRIFQSDGLNLLLREQRFQDDPIASAPLRSLVALNVNSFRIEGLRDLANGSVSSRAPDNLPDPSVKNLTRRVRLRIGFDGTDAGAAHAIDQVLCLR